jgi:hypothetical protein
MSSTAYYSVEKLFYDYADNIEAVNIHYAVTLIGGIPDWEHYRCTRYMPIVKENTRIKVLRLHKEITSPEADASTARYLLHYYFEIFQDGDRHYTPLFTEEIDTDLPASNLTALPSQKSPAQRNLLLEGS